jgi:hypothetical protein
MTSEAVVEVDVEVNKENPDGMLSDKETIDVASRIVTDTINSFPEDMNAKQRLAHLVEAREVYTLTAKILDQMVEAQAGTKH